ncbi:SCP2 sterol-binding domain-containing protein [Pseudoxanthomonas sp. PXM03]|uniref:ubiquinone biosynthesis accessory factor UbiJ n=1 Tax=Pseudoxanthomonas sp. PXM03 TaxID=2769284 RepID=UPI001781D28F|nr:SCP2 sterol-binding domain-containing protein [Pseudoxanthomonas sp. PXM03]MBD9434535.1 SCP2 sterol-binding domain-containing protein [Pseudoxanthomonas sp. PXM03]
MDLSPFDALKPLAGRALEAALNQAIALDPDTSAALRPLEGRRIQLVVDAPPLAMDIMVGGGRLQVGPASEVLEADLAVRSTLGGLLGQLPFLRRDNATPVGKVKVSGDAELARRLQTLATRFDPDWSLPFTRVFGDVIGVQVANAVRAGLQQARIAAGNLAESAAEYVTEESRDVVGRDELNAFHDDVDAMRDDVERLAVRIGRLAARVEHRA